MCCGICHFVKFIIFSGRKLEYLQKTKIHATDGFSEKEIEVIAEEVEYLKPRDEKENNDDKFQDCECRCRVVKGKPISGQEWKRNREQEVT